MLKNNLRQQLIKIALVIIFFGWLIFLNPRNFFNPVREIFFRITAPFEKTFYFFSWKAHRAGEALSSIGELKKENSRLSEENLKLLSENARLRDIEKENEILRNELEMLPRNKFELEPARVISYDSRAPGNWIKIDKGKKDGIENGMPIIISESVMVGKVEEVFSESSRVILTTNSQSSINAVVDTTETKGIVKGKYGLKMIMDMILQTDPINVGDNVITLGTGSRIPRGLLMGTVSEIKLSSDQLFKQAVVSPIFDFSKLNIVFAIKDSSSKTD